MTNSNVYTAWVSEMGGRDIATNDFIDQQPYAGSLFKSQNNSTWTPDQMRDLKMTLNRAKFTTAYQKFNERFPTIYGYRKKQRNEWYLKMKKAGIKRKKRKYHIMPKDLSVHTHDKCRVPVWPLLTKRSLNGKK